MRHSRRDFISRAGALASGVGLAPLRLGAQRAPSYREEMGDMLVAWLASRLNALDARWDQERDRIKTPRQLEARNLFVREKVREMIHGLPEIRNMASRTVGSFERRGYRVENVMFESRPNFWVTGNLYVPPDRPARSRASYRLAAIIPAGVWSRSISSPT